MLRSCGDLNGRALSVWLLLGVLAAPVPAAAQDAAVSGTVTDTTGLRAARRDCGRPRRGRRSGVETAVSDGTGIVYARLCRPAPTTVTFTLPGFQDAVRDAVEVGAGAAVTLDVELAVELEERVVVVGSRAQPRSVTESQVPIDAIPVPGRRQPGPHDARLSVADAGALVQRRHASDQRRGHPRAASQHPQPRARPHAGAGQRQAPPPLVGHRLVRRGDRRLAGTGHLDHPDHRPAAGGGPAGRRLGAVRLGRDRRGAELPAQGQPRRAAASS